MASVKKKRPSRATVEDGGDPVAKGSPQKKHKPLPESKFGGMTEEEVCKLLLPDHMKADLDIIFVRACGDSVNCSTLYPTSDWHQSRSLLCLPRPPLLQRQQPLL